MPVIIDHRIRLPTFHTDQVNAYWASTTTDRFLLRCGRRWGKTKWGTTRACDSMAKGKRAAWIAPSDKFLGEPRALIRETMQPIRINNGVPGQIAVMGGGICDFWSLEAALIVRGRFYDDVYIDEAAFAQNQTDLMEQWERAIEPALLDMGGSCFVMSNTNGENEENFVWRISTQRKYGFKEYHAPTTANPNMPLRRRHEGDQEYAERRASVIADLKEKTDPRVYSQEYEAEFVDWSGASFFSKDKLLINGQGAPIPTKADGVFAIVDTASKTGKENDGTAVVYFLRDIYNPIAPLVVLDWDIMQIEGALLETWLPNVFKQLDAYTHQIALRNGSMGTFIEDKDSGTVLIQQAVRRQWPAQAIDSDLTAMGKEERAISISGYVYQGKVKLSQLAFEKVKNYKGVERNHLLGQVTQFKIGDPDAGEREDDLLDGFCYGVALTFGDSRGF